MASDMANEQTIGESKQTIRELTLAEAASVSGGVHTTPLPEPFPQPSPTNPNG